MGREIVGVVPNGKEVLEIWSGVGDSLEESGEGE